MLPALPCRPACPARLQMYGEAGKHSNAQALFNMGLMHQFGAGLPRDFHLAKRFYDRCGQVAACGCGCGREPLRRVTAWVPGHW
jgi:hypothetical protein